MLKIINNPAFRQDSEVLAEVFEGCGQDQTDGCNNNGTCEQDYQTTIESWQGDGYTYDQTNQYGFGYIKGDAPGDGSAAGTGDASIASDLELFDEDEDF
jgi:hypothetical protein